MTALMLDHEVAVARHRAAEPARLSALARLLDAEAPGLVRRARNARLLRLTARPDMPDAALVAKLRGQA